ncbi:hypothetical protein [Pararhodospirillum photometricum]|uniref:hypothetical protein n=1 Tax=Pararhodospirillum photometricum TaxID=1084 RepID=UPI00031CAB3F|nr:hypothetical protein [Pararhodospirillum photometricum]
MITRLLDLDAYHLPTGRLHRWRLCTPPTYQLRGGPWPGLCYLPLVVQPPEVTVSVASPSAPARLSVGGVVLANHLWGGPRQWWVEDVATGALVEVALPGRPLTPLLTEYAVAGRRVVERLIEVGGAYSSAQSVFSGVVAADPKQSKIYQIDIEVMGQEELCNIALQSDLDVYKNEDIFGEHEDVRESLKGKSREVALGECVVEPTYRGTRDGRHVYSVNGVRRVHAVEWVSNRGSRYTRVAADPGIGEWTADLASSLLTLGGAKPESLRAKVVGDAPGGEYLATLGQVAGLVLGRAGLPGLPCDLHQVVGLAYAPGDAPTVATVLDSLAASVARGGWYVTHAGSVWLGRLPGFGPAVATYRAGVNCSPAVPSLSAGGNAPARAVALQWGAVPEVDDLADAATAQDQALLATTWRTVRRAAVDVAAAYPLAREVTVETALQRATDAEAEATALLTDRSVVRRTCSLDVYDGAPGLDVGAVIHVTGGALVPGRTCVVLGRESRGRLRRTSLIVSPL